MWLIIQEHTVYVRQGLDAPTIFRGLAQELARAHMERDGSPAKAPISRRTACLICCAKEWYIGRGLFL